MSEPRNPNSTLTTGEVWPSLPLDAWQDTYATLHMWTQVVGKIRLALAPPVNHSWHVTLYPTCRGLTTSPMAYGSRLLEIEFDFLEHQLQVRTNTEEHRALPLAARPVAEFYRETLEALASLGITLQLWSMPVEVEQPIPFEQDRVHAAYDPEYAQRCWRVLLQSYRVLNEFRGRFIGKSSPAHFFWGSFDLALTRFSGRTAPPHPGGIPHLADRVTREAYSHEVSSFGFWPGGGPISEPVFYSYAYPEPAGYAETPVEPAEAYYSRDLHEFVLPYEAVRTAQSPDAALLSFFQSTYEAAANRGGWDRAALEAAQLGE
ncbi:MAG TPA: DUF5996 family protein [Armatimonadota bacterium]|nr:DUF5996 family protein [Armatimonadota bacterium]